MQRVDVNLIVDREKEEEELVLARQKVSDLSGNRFVRHIELLVLRKYPRRYVSSTSYSGLVCSAVGRDNSGIVGIVLWSDDVERVKAGDAIRIVNGWCRQQDDQLVVSQGRFGRVEIIES
jgi:ssDNA-binding replication factor A large subunit